MEKLPYQVYNRAGELVLQAAGSCRSVKRIERDQLENGYTIYLHGRPVGQTGQRKGAQNDAG